MYAHMRLACKHYRKRYGTYDRPAVLDRRNRIGDWEGDTIIGKWRRKGALLAMVERKTRYTVIVKLTGKLADAAITTMAKIKG